jgi:hypothetical protein
MGVVDSNETKVTQVRFSKHAKKVFVSVACKFNRDCACPFFFVRPLSSVPPRSTIRNMSQVKDAYGNVLEADPSKLNKNQIKSILTQNGISLPGSDKDKAVCLHSCASNTIDCAPLCRRLGRYSNFFRFGIFVAFDFFSSLRIFGSNSKPLPFLFL